MSIYIGQDRKVWVGDEASEKLKNENDVKWVRGKSGVIKVDKGRWLKAQAFERKTWMEDGRWTREDNNRRHTEGFNGYASLRGKAFNNGIELGSGPFTNIRHAARWCEINNIYLLDPLIKDYLHHAFCRYKRGKMWLWKKIGSTNLRWPMIKPVRIIDNKIEGWESSDKFDLILLVNVLEHCQDVEAVWQKMLNIAAVGAVLVFADKYYNGERLPEVLKERYDAGHPLKVDRSVIDEFLSNNWDEWYRQVAYKEGRAGRTSWDDHEMVYFIGQKKEDTTCDGGESG